MATTKLFLHIGGPKTGSTSIQQSFFKSTPALRKHGLEYFQYGANHSAAIGWLFSAKRNEFHDITLKHRLTEPELAAKREEIEDALEAFLREPSADKKIISGEGISILTEPEAARLRKHINDIRDCEIKVILYIRNVYDFLDSIIQQQVKSGTTIEDIKQALVAGQGGRAVLPRYAAIIENFSNAFGSGSVDVRVFDKSFFQEGDLLADFCHAIETPQLFQDLTQIVANTSVSDETVRILSKYNELFPVRIGNSYNPQRTEKVASYFNTSDGAKFRVRDPEVLNAYEALLADDIKFLRRKLDRRAAACVVERKTSKGEPPESEGTSFNFDYVFKTLGQALRDLESFEKSLDVAIVGLSNDISDVEACRRISRNLRFISVDDLCRRISRAFSKKEKIQAALMVAQRALELDPNNAENHTLLSNLYWRQGQWEAAERGYKDALALDPTNSAAYRKLSACLIRLKRPSEAAAAAQKAVDLCPESEEYRRHLEKLMARQDLQGQQRGTDAVQH